ncbi:hypothetical protein [Streptomyces sp. L2]|uniref:hypothetical protein n=1 Tax=Streptomyces sp. L2 TaxID=2162665 RepID=UPI0032202E44
MTWVKLCGLWAGSIVEWCRPALVTVTWMKPVVFFSFISRNSRPSRQKMKKMMASTIACDGIFSSVCDMSVAFHTAPRSGSVPEGVMI